MRLLRCIKVLAVVGAIASLLASSPALAVQPQEPVALGVTPAITEIVLERGRQNTATITIANVTDKPIPIKGTVASMVPFEQVAETDRKLFDASAWLTISEPTFILQPKQHKKIVITAAAPKDAEPGGHYATVFFQPVTAAETIQANAAYVGSKVGVLAFMIVKGDIQEQLSVQGFSSTMFVHQKGPVPINLSLRNSGSVHLLPTGTIEIMDIFGRKVGSIPLPTNIVLPKTTKDLSFMWDNKGGPGYFTAQAVIKYGTHGATLTERQTFLIVPWLAVAIAIFIFMLLGVVVGRTRGRWLRALKALTSKREDKSSIDTRKRL